MLEHGFSWYRIILLALIILICFGIRYGIIIVPQVRSTANQVANLNNLQKVDVKGEVGGCIPIYIKGSV